jgi:phage terminase small subunit
MTAKPWKHLHRRGRELFRIITSDFCLAPHHFIALRVACECLDRLEGCRARLAREGLTTKDKWGQVKIHPLVAAERDSRGQFIQALAQLGLDEEDIAERTPARRPGQFRVVSGQKGR